MLAAHGVPIAVTDINPLLEIMRRLRDPDNGCPWDLEQNFASIVPHTLEEAYEVADCIERDDIAALPGELGDLLFQVVFYAALGCEQERFDFTDVVQSISDKLIERHPHVFGAGQIGSAAEQTSAWEDRKAAERAARKKSATLDDVPLGLPALTRARKLQLRASRVGFDWDDVAEVKMKVLEELDELDEAVEQGARAAIAEEMGDLLFACVNWARHLDVDPESALRAASRKFERRFGFVEASLAGEGRALTQASLAEMDALWDEAKRRERG